MLNWFRHLTTPAGDPAPGDPFAHPEISAMSHRDLADLPLIPPPAPAQRREAAVAAKPLRRVTC
jgi:hypothetical protein